MTGLSEQERNGCAKLLGFMTDGDVRLLFDTVTNKAIQAHSTREAKKAIICYTHSAAELLKRRKVHRDVIFRYLAGEGVVMPVNSDKQQLVLRALELWASGQEPPPHQAPLPLPKIAIQPTEVIVETTAEALGQQFCQWFFELLNSQNPSWGKTPQDWGPQHFWTDAKLNILARTEQHRSEEHQGAHPVSKRLLLLAKEEGLLFSPNLGSHGLRVASSPHGLVLVAVAGTVHNCGQCLGIFEQAFGLIRSPTDNTWKIKFTSLKVRGHGVSDGVDGMSPVVTCDFNELQHLATL